MSEDKDPQTTGHSYDGIQEFDNPLPAWWLWTFFITIIFGFLYWVHYEFGGGPTLMAELDKDMAAIQKLHKPGSGPQESEEDLAQLAGAAPILEKGKSVFVAKCAACHGNELQGLIGPNLIDDYWIHGRGKLTDIAQVVRKGVLDKGMPPWEGQIADEEIKAVTVYIASNRGSNPPNAKAPQGEKVVSQ